MKILYLTILSIIFLAEIFGTTVRDTAQDTLKNAKENTQDTLKNAKENTQDTLRNAKDNTQDTLKKAKDNTQDTLKKAKDNTQDTLRNAKDNTQDTLRNAKENTVETLRNAKENTQDKLKYAKDNIQDTLRNAKENTVETLRNAKENTQEKLKYAKDNIQDTLRNAKENTQEKLKYVKDEIYDTLENTAQNKSTKEIMTDAVKDRVQNVEDTVKDTVQGVKETVKETVQGTVNAVKSLSNSFTDITSRIDILGESDDPNVVSFKDVVQNQYNTMKTSLENFLRGFARKAKSEYDVEFKDLQDKFSTGINYLQEAKEATYHKISEGIKDTDEKKNQIRESWNNAGNDLTSFFERMSNNFQRVWKTILTHHEKYQDKPILKCHRNEYSLTEFLDNCSMEYILFDHMDRMDEGLVEWANRISPCPEGSWEILPEKPDL